jgi:hypothetical protein
MFSYERLTFFGPIIFSIRHACFSPCERFLYNRISNVKCLRF